MEVVVNFFMLELAYQKKENNMEVNEIFVYTVKEGKVVQEVWNCKEKSKYSYYIRATKGNRQIIHESQLDKCERNRVVSFIDDFPRFRQLIIDDMEARIKIEAARLKQKKKILKSIQAN